MMYLFILLNDSGDNKKNVYNDNDQYSLIRFRL